MDNLPKTRKGRLSALAVSILLAASAAGAQDAGAPPTSGIACRDLIAMTPAETEPVLYFIAGYQAALDDQAGAGVEATEFMGAAAVGGPEAPVDPRLNQMVAPLPGGIFHIDREVIWSACQEQPDRPAGEVLREVLDGE